MENVIRSHLHNDGSEVMTRVIVLLRSWQVAHIDKRQ